MRRVPLALLLVALCGCTRKDPLYCDEATPCRQGLVCAMPEHECRRGDEVPDLAGGDQGAPDMRMPDMITPAECTSGAECPAARPVCEGGRCRPCSRNFDCPDSACDEGGACHDRARVLVVDDAMGACRRSGEPAGRPYCYVSEALRDPDLGRGKDVILIRPSTRGGHRLEGNYLEIKETVRLVGARQRRGDPPVLVREPVTITATKDISVGIEDLHIGQLDSGGVHGIFCSGQFGGPRIAFTLRWSRVTGAPNSGVATQFCSPVRLVSNQIQGNATNRTTSATGVSVSGGELTMLNNIVAGNGEGSLTGGGVHLIGLDRATVAFNTFTANQCAGLMSAGCNLTCEGSDTVPVSYSILVGTAAGRRSIDGSCQVTNSVVPAGFMGSGNITITPAFVAAAQGDYHLSPTAPENKMLRRPEMSPAVTFDIDDDPRPAGAVDIGADQIP